MKRLNVAAIAIVGIFIGWLTLGGSAAVMHYTSSTEFCLSCHSMQIPYEEYQGSIHFSNAKGIRAECSNCHIPTDLMDYVITKFRATKDIYHEFVSGKIDNEDKYEDHRLAMAETVWEQMRQSDSATCRSCHEIGAMDTYEQTEEAAKMHEYGVANNQTCIDCHKGVAHFAPEPELDSEAFSNLMAYSESTDPNAEVVYAISPLSIGELGTINPTTKMLVINANGDERTIRVEGYQMRGAEQVLYINQGQRAIIASLTEQGQQAIAFGEYQADRYGNEWRTASLTGPINAPVLESQQPIWDYAEQLDTVYCSTCHAKIAAHHFTVNAWGPVAKGMGDRTDISALDLELLTKFFQYHAKDVAGH
ncbi:cytochrome C [Photobacterium gaetbulicola]|uniref:Cytochrome c-type protein n=1 Tax=Photobacterium gaetbulicola TaxID=1295392 RepID=A0A0B9GM72_9GAMM|nr:NapC/NirT family cytochrome c [Photobacterium gaetbulicola]KHT57937.1 cytochrome C [Photobacterium gaetbulicola]